MLEGKQSAIVCGSWFVRGTLQDPGRTAGVEYCEGSSSGVSRWRGAAALRRGWD